MSGSTHASRTPRGPAAFALLFAALAGACRGGAELRPVVCSAPIITRVTVTETGPAEKDGADPEEDVEAARVPELSLTEAILSLGVPSESMAGATGPGALLGSAPVQLDPGLGPIDLGYPLLVDLGAGDAPYDDGVPTIHVDEPKRGGFSDSVIQVTWREQLTSQLTLHGGAAIFRYQDLGILDSLPESRFGFAVVGIHSASEDRDRRFSPSSGEAMADAPGRPPPTSR